MTADIESTIRAIVRDEVQRANLADMPHAVTVKQASVMMAMSERSIRRLMERGELPFSRVGDKAIRIKVGDIHRLLEAAP